MDDPKSTMVGYGNCPHCGVSAPVKADRGGKLYLHCIDETGDCGIGQKPVSRRSNVRMAGLVTRWVKPAFRAHYLGGGADHEPAEETADPETYVVELEDDDDEDDDAEN